MIGECIGVYTATVAFIAAIGALTLGTAAWIARTAGHSTVPRAG